MFLAIRDIYSARGRFALLGLVVGLITLLVVLLSGLTAGLASQSTSAVTSLPGSHIVFGATGEATPEVSFADSAITEQQLHTWRDAQAPAWVEPLGLTPGQAELEDSGSTAVTVLAARPHSVLAPDDLGDTGVVVSASLAEEEGVDTGDTIGLGDVDYPVTGTTPAAYYSHTPVVWTSLESWRDMVPTGSDPPTATVLVADLDGQDPAELDEAATTVTETHTDSRAGVASFSAENGSLLMIQGFLYVISALVVGAFLTVWTIQRAGDVAVLKALGGSTSYLVRDALVQAAIVLTLGAGVGATLGWGVGALAERTVPFELSGATTIPPVLGMLGLGMLGAVLTVRRITSVDPLTALGSAR
ncbi:ABC transporter permease [Lipingzhangella sp. LS1_29]|uniref:ABC transporter permease n=1 Tax=Lipingzhangella rawalii TaxID=2055835 RepID=A0ABU2H8J7_9ACTN|nr:ABC transporter permease [Lipingzhangella rawalii]MDS1271160.1 ABC transporter permease [Lipingzhangella rawalii]